MKSQHRVGNDYREMSTIELIKKYIASKIKTPPNKQPYYNRDNDVPEPPKDVNINHIAVVLDGKVEEIVRCQNRLAALLLSEPIFVEYDPEQINVKVGITEYISDNLVNVEEPIISKEEIDRLIESEVDKRKND